MSKGNILRYPGGKTKLIDKIMLSLNPLLIIATDYHDPFVGGGSVALHVAQKYPSLKIHLNDKDPNIASLWKMIATGSDADIGALHDSLKVSPTTKLFYDLQEKQPSSTLEAAQRTILLNRMSFSGMLDSGPIGGKDQNGKYKIDSRFNYARICSDILKARKLLYGRTTVENISALEYLKRQFSKTDVLYLDPPYYLQGPNLYPVFMSDEEHQAFSSKLRYLNNWVLSYDAANEIKNLYESWSDIHSLYSTYSISIGYGERKERNELLITPKENQAEPISMTSENIAEDPILTGETESQEEEKTNNNQQVQVGQNRQPQTDVPVIMTEKAEKYSKKVLGHDLPAAISFHDDLQNIRIDMDGYMDTESAKRFTGRSASWLQHNHEIPYIKGRPNRYHIDDLRKWKQRHKTRRKIAEQ